MDGNAHHLRRRLSAVLCADVVGYSTHMQHDERATHLAYKACVDEFIDPLVSSHFGNIVKSTGDGFFAQFDSVVAAMECAIAIQTELRNFFENNSISPALQFRIGVNSGDIISEKEDIYGNDVNLAARLQEQAQPGAVCVTAGTYEQVKDKISAQFKNLGEITFKNENVPTQVYACYPQGITLSPITAWQLRLFKFSNVLAGRKHHIVISAFAVVLVIAVFGILGTRYLDISSKFNQNIASSKFARGVETEHPSIAVLAFENISLTSDARSLSFGIGETIATALAASQRFFVIDPKSSLEYSSASPSLKNIADQLNVRFLLLGSVNQKGQKIRVNARLVDMRSGRNHWAYSGQEDLDKIFDIEDKISNEVIASLSEGPQTPAGREVRGATRDIAAYRSFLKGWQLLKTKPIPKFDAAIPLLEKAVLSDPSYGNAHAALAAAYVAKSNYIFRNVPNSSKRFANLGERVLSDMWGIRQDYLDKARTYLNFALKDPTAYAYRISSQIHYVENDYASAARDARNAYLRDPSDADSAAEYGMSLIWNGETEDGVKQIEKAIRTNPSGKEFYRGYLGIAKFNGQQYLTALTDLETALNVEPHEESMMIHMIAAFGHLNDLKKSAEYIQRLNKTRVMRGLTPIFVQRIMRKLPYKHQSDRLHLAAGLHKAGMKYGVKHLSED